MYFEPDNYRMSIDNYKKILMFALDSCDSHEVQSKEAKKTLKSAVNGARGH